MVGRIEERPQRGQVVGGVPAGDVTPVDEAGDPSAPGQHVAGVQIAVQPDRVSVGRSLEASFPHARRSLAQLGQIRATRCDLGQAAPEGGVSLAERNAPIRIGRCLGRGLDVEVDQQPSQPADL